jgi:hypothetical protein
MQKSLGVFKNEETVELLYGSEIVQDHQDQHNPTIL